MHTSQRLSGFFGLLSQSTAYLFTDSGGQGYSGSTQCDAGLACVVLNQWYSQCQTGSGTPVPPVISTSVPPVTPTQPPLPPVSSSTVAPPTATTPPAANIPAGQLTRLSSFGSNPSNVGIFVYKPANVRPGAGLLVALHPCGGTAQQYFSSNAFRSLSDQRGFIVLYGQAPNNSNCWDIAGNATKTHNGGSDSLGVASAVRFAISDWGINPDKVFVTGTSSGAMMTNVMAGAYPELFKAGAVFAGTGFGCLVTNAPSFPPDPCAAGNKVLSAREWGNLIRAGYPGYTGAFPKMQIWHGTSDPVLNIVNFQEQVKQWTDIHGISQTPTSTSNNTPKSGWTKTVYGTGQLEAFRGQGAGHGLPESGTEVAAIDWFGL
ncbi:alpha/beta-hydrolase [Coprinopsis marcescibilis]|uniref:Carboxylic ester hydrolase n=1 Tax=Coprinopsis marcescibilis TaxID=230819 RepID=A0A5C3KF56_COPMA|nr:alpha/beta-hydrolase [Coprinopsis marcescibilis]